MGLRYQFISTPPVILLITRGTQLFFVGRDVGGGSPKWPGAFVKHCKSTVGANRLAGPIMS